MLIAHNQYHIHMRFPNGLAKALTLSYDDGVTEDIRLIEIMDRYGLKGTFNICSGQYVREGERSRPDRDYGQRMTYEAATALYKNSGHEIALHFNTHQSLDRLAPAQVAYEVIKNRELLEAQFGRIVRGMAYPYGAYSDEVVDVLRHCGVTYCRTTKSTLGFDIPTDWLRMPATCHHANEHLFELVDQFLNKKLTERHAPILFYLWGHSFEFERDQNWDVIERFGALMGGRDDVWYATNTEIYEYVEAYRALIFSADRRIVKNPTAQTVWFCFEKQIYRVDAGETVVLYDRPVD